MFLFNKEVAGSIPPPFPWAKESNRNSYLKLRQDRRNFRWFNGYVIRSIPVTNGIDDGLDENFLWQPRHGKFWLLTRGWDDEDPKDQGPPPLPGTKAASHRKVTRTLLYFSTVATVACYGRCQTSEYPEALQHCPALRHHRNEKVS